MCPMIYIYFNVVAHKKTSKSLSPVVPAPLSHFTSHCGPAGKKLAPPWTRMTQQCMSIMRAHATHQAFNDPEQCALDAQCVVLHVRMHQALEAAQARRRQAVVAVAAVQLHQQGDALQGLLPHLLVLTGKLQGVNKQLVNGRNFGVRFHPLWDVHYILI